MDAEPRPPAPSRRRRAVSLSPQARLTLGLLLTFLGLFLLVSLLPLSPPLLAHALPVAAGGILALWVGGIFLGRGGGAGGRARSIAPAP